MPERSRWLLPEDLAALPLEEIPAHLGRLAEAGATLWLRLLTAPRPSLNPARQTEEDRLLTIAEAAKKLACSRDWLYRHAHELSFVVRVGGRLRCSVKGIECWIQDRAGR